MAFPTIPTSAGSTLASVNQLNTTATLTGPNLSALTKAPGDLIIAIAGEYQSNAGTDAAFTGWAGGGLTWTEIRDSTGTAVNRLGVAYARVVTGSETGTVTVTRSGTLVGDAAMMLMVISGAHSTAAPEVTVMATGTGTAAPAALTPSWGADDTLWIGVNGNGMTSGTGSWTGTTGAPTNYTGFFDTAATDTSTIGDFDLAVAFRQLNAATETMGAFTQDTSNARNSTVLIAVRPAPSTAKTATATRTGTGTIAAVGQALGADGVGYVETAWNTPGTFSVNVQYKDITVGVSTNDRLFLFGASANAGGAGVAAIVNQGGTAAVADWTIVGSNNTNGTPGFVMGWTDVLDGGSATIRTTVAATTSGMPMGVGVWVLPAGSFTGVPTFAGNMLNDTDALQSTTLTATSFVFYGAADWDAGPVNSTFTPAGYVVDDATLVASNYTTAIAHWTQQASGTRNYGLASEAGNWAGGVMVQPFQAINYNGSATLSGTGSISASGVVGTSASASRTGTGAITASGTVSTGGSVRVQSAVNADTAPGAYATTMAATFTNPTAVNNKIVVFGTWAGNDSSNLFNITDSQGNTYTKGKFYDATNDQSIFWGYATASAATAATVTLTTFSTNYKGIIVAEYSNLGALLAGPSINNTTGTTAANNVTSVATGTLSDTPSMVIGFVMDDANASNTFTAGTGFTLFQSPGSMIMFAAEDRPYTGTASTSATFTAGTALRYMAAALVFKDTGAAVTNYNGSATLTGTGSITAGGVVNVAGTGTVVFGGTGSITAAGTMAATATATLAGTGLIVPRPSGTGLPFVTSIHSSGRYFLDQRGDPILVKGDSPWIGFAAISTTDWATYCSARASQGYNALIVDAVAWNLLNGAGVPGSPDAYTNGVTYDGVHPFTGDNIATPNETYWSRVDTMISTAETNGLTCFIFAVDTYSFGTGEIFNGKSDAQMNAYGQFLGNRYKTRPNIVWMYGNDYQPDATRDARLAQVISGIASTGDTHMYSMMGYYHLSYSWQYTNWTGTSWYGVYTYPVQYDSIKISYDHSPTKPSVMIEAAYVGESYTGGDVPLTVHKQAGWSLSQGAAGDFIGTEDWWFKTGWGGRLSRTEVSEVGTIHAAFEGMQWWTLVPSTSFVTSGAGTRLTATNSNPGSADWPAASDYASSAVSADGTLAMVYLPAQRAITINTAALTGSPVGLWINVSTGAQTTAGTLSGSLTPPTTGDFLLRITQLVNYNRTTTLSGTGSITAAGGIQALASSTLAGTGSLTAAGVVARSSGATLAGSPAITAVGVVARTATATLAGTDSLTAAGLVGAQSTASLAGTGAISAAGTVATTSGATLAGSGTITAVATMGVGGNLTGTGSLSATGVVARSSGATLAGAPAVTAAGTVGRLTTSALAGAPAITTAGQVGLFRTAALAGTDTITAAGTVVVNSSGAVTLTGTGSIAAAGVVASSSGAVLAGTDTISSAGAVGTAKSASLAGTGAITTAGVVGTSAGAAITGTDTITTAERTAYTRTASIAATGAITAAGGQTSSTAVQFGGTVTIVAAGRVDTSSSANLNGVGGIVTNKALGSYASASIDGVGAFLVNGAANKTATATLSGTGSVTANGISTLFRSSTLAGVGAFSTTGVKGTQDTGTLSGTGSFTVTGVLEASTDTGLDGVGTLTAEGVVGVQAEAVLAGTGHWYVASGHVENVVVIGVTLKPKRTFTSVSVQRNFSAKAVQMPYDVDVLKDQY